MIETVKAHPYWTLYIIAAISFGIGTGFAEGVGAGFTSFGGSIVFGMFIHFMFGD